MKTALGIFILAAGGFVVFAETGLRQKRLQQAKNRSDKHKRINQQMDRALDDSFPASDPPSWNSSAV